MGITDPADPPAPQIRYLAGIDDLSPLRLTMTRATSYVFASAHPGEGHPVPDRGQVPAARSPGPSDRARTRAALAEHVLFGSDYPHPEGLREPRDYVGRLAAATSRSLAGAPREHGQPPQAARPHTGAGRLARLAQLAPWRGVKEVVRPQRAAKRKESTHSPPFSIYSAPGGLRQDPGHAAQWSAGARNCGNGSREVRVLLSAYGSRGDVEPMPGVAVWLRALGAQVRACAPAQAPCRAQWWPATSDRS